MPGAAVPLALQRLGVPLVLAPFRTRAGAPFAVAGGFADLFAPGNIVDLAAGVRARHPGSGRG